jgi:hypothetical protein
MDGNAGRTLAWTVWPAFMVAAAAEVVFFSVFDPFDLHFFGAPLNLSREAMYTLGFFGFWGLGIASSALTVFLGKSSSRVNRWPLDSAELPEAGSKPPLERPGSGAPLCL